ncbi:MAG: response regulator [Fibromonadaceae bacterium]|nr:response regulator [Fibromonadaceae bacterium]
MKIIFVVDDSSVNLAMTKHVLTEGGYRVFTLPSAEKMFSFFSKVMPDLILLDIEMPEMDGFTAIKRLKANEKTVNIPVIFLTVHADADIEYRGLELGAVDFITKPFAAPVLLNRIASHMNIDELVKKRTAEILKLQNGIIFTIANMVENRDKVTGGHIARTSSYIKILLEGMIAKKLYTDKIMEWDLDMVINSSRLHDVGKIAVSDLILNKPDKLTPEEFAEIRLHAEKGEAIIDDMIAETGNAVFLQHSKLFAGYHHERWDGKGYPRELMGEDIPLQGRIMAIADVYDALVSERPYKPAFPSEEAEDIIIKSSGTFFDPQIIEVFKEVKGQFADVVRELKAK